jgi:RimJ/RimL family protein N-acetyltransferase
MQGNPEYRLRQPEPTDIEALYQYRNDPWIVSELGCFSGGFARADVAEWIDSQRRSKDDFVWVIANLEDHCIGHCGLYHINSRNGSAELDLCIGDAGSRNQGIGETIGRTLLRYSFAQLNLHRLRAQAMKSNAVAARLLYKLGFSREAGLREVTFRDGQFQDWHVFGILQREWQSLTADSLGGQR